MLPNVPPTTATAPPNTATAGASRRTVRTRPLDGALTGLAASVLAGLAWWAVVALAAPTFEWWHVGAAGLGIVVGFGVLLGSRRGGIAPGIIAAVIATLATVVAVYFIDRSVTIAALEDLGQTSDIPLWAGFSNAADVITGWIDFDVARAAAWLLAPLFAFGVAALGRQTPGGS